MRKLARTGEAGRWPPPLSYLPRALLEPRRPLLAIAVGWAIAFFPSIALGAAVSGFLPTLEQPQLAVDNQLAVAFIVILAPLIETLIMGAVLALLLWIMPPAAAVLISAAGWGIAHSLVAPAWGLVIWWPFLVFSTLFVTWRQRSLAAALAIPATVHGLHNLLPALALFATMGR